MFCRGALALFLCAAFVSPAPAQIDLGPPVQPTTVFSHVRLKVRHASDELFVRIDAAGRVVAYQLEQGQLTSGPLMQLSAGQLTHLAGLVQTAALGQPGAQLLPFSPQGVHVDLEVRSQDAALDGSRTGYQSNTTPLPAGADARLAELLGRLHGWCAATTWPRQPFDDVVLEARGSAAEPRLRVRVGGDGELHVQEIDHSASPPLDHDASRSLTLAEWTRLQAALRAADLHGLPATLGAAGGPTAPAQFVLRVRGEQAFEGWRVETAGTYPSQQPGADALIGVLLDLAKPLRQPSATTGLVGSLQTP